MGRPAYEGYYGRPCALVNRMATLVLQSFGNKTEYARAVFAILSYFAHASDQSRCVLVYTDDSDFLSRYLKGFPVEYIPLTQDDLKRMRGDIDFLHRIKIEVIENAFSRRREALLYLDSDTFFIADPATTLDQVRPGQAFMHKHEYEFNQLRLSDLPAGAIDHAVIGLIDRDNLHLSQGESVHVTGEFSSWNAGVMILDFSHAALLPDVYSLTKQIYLGTGSHASEQFAFSIILQTRGLVKPCDHVIYHYWYRVEKKIVDSFLARRLNEPWAAQPPDKKLHDIRKWSTALPGIIDRHVWLIRDRSIQAFNENNFSRGFGLSLRAMIKSPWNLQFAKDVAYHTKRYLRRSKST